MAYDVDIFMHCTAQTHCNRKQYEPANHTTQLPINSQHYYIVASHYSYSTQVVSTVLWIHDKLEGAQCSESAYIRQVNFTAVLLIYYRTLANCVSNDVIAI